MEGARTSSDAAPDVERVSAALMNMVCGGAQLSRKLPEGEDMRFFMSVEPELRPLYEEAKRNCLTLAQKLMDLNAAGTKSRVPNITSSEDVDELLALYPAVVENSTDPLVENVVSYFDHKSGINALSEAPVTATTDFVVRQNSRSYHLVHREGVERPQIHFDKVDNSKAPFVPKIAEKPNSLKPLAECFKASEPNHANPVEKVALPSDVQSHISSLGLTATPGSPLSLPNPYEYEIDNFDYSPEQLEGHEEIMYKSLESTSFTMVEDVATLKLMHEKLKRASEIAIDLEQHSFRSYQGFVCLMQISTRTEDFVVDALALRRELPLLLDVFTDPKIVKVMHGSDSDIVWLQRDFGLYIVNLFDTGQATRVLEYPKNSLAYLLMHFCNVKAKKEYQLADWRIRPLPSELIEYARSDTHYLLYIYDRLRKELLLSGNSAKNLLLAVLSRSRELCKKTYYKTMFLSTKEAIYNRAPGSFSLEQLKVFDAVFEWRDEIAREEDESPGYVLPNKLLILIAELMPETVRELLSCCGDAAATPLLKAHAATVAKLIADTKRGVSSTMASPLPVKAKPVDFLSPVVGLAPVQQAQQSAAPSPVLNQDQLFQQADWLQSSPSNFSHHTSNPRRSAECDPLNAGFSANMRGSHFFGVSKSQVHSGQHKAAKIMDSLTVESLFSFQVEPDQFDAKPKDRRAEAPVDDPMDVDEVPCSMEEIYQLSNLNRKRNKEKKKLKEDSIKAGPPSPIAFEDEEEVSRKDRPAEDTKEFIAKIGWPADFLTESQPDSGNDQAAHKQRRAHRRTKSITQDAANNGGRRQGGNSKAHDSSRKKRSRSNNKTFPPKSSFDYSGSGTSGFNPSGSSSQESAGHQAITVPQLGRSSNRARAKGQKSHSYKSSSQRSARN